MKQLWYGAFQLWLHVEAPGSEGAGERERGEGKGKEEAEENKKRKRPEQSTFGVFSQ